LTTSISLKAGLPHQPSGQDHPRWVLRGAPKASATRDGSRPGAALGPRTTGRSRTTTDSDGQPAAQVNSRFRAFAQVVRSPGLSLARRRSSGASPSKARHDLLHNQPEEPDRARPSAAPAARRPAGGSAPPSSAGGHQASLGTAACLPWPSATRSWATRAGCRLPRRSGGSYGCRLRCCCWVGLPRRIPFVWAGSDAAPELGLDQVFVRPRQGCAEATC
jgi:hypothetical protein